MGKKKISTFNPNAYRKNVYNVVEVTTPSGFKFKIRKLSPIHFIENGMKDLPAPFLEFVQSGQSSEKLMEAIQDNDSLKMMEKMLGIIISDGIVEPKIKIKYKDGKDKEDVLYWGEILQEDQAFLINQITGSTIKKA